MLSSNSNLQDYRANLFSVGRGIRARQRDTARGTLRRLPRTSLSCHQGRKAWHIFDCAKHLELKCKVNRLSGNSTSSLTVQILVT